MRKEREREKFTERSTESVISEFSFFTEDSVNSFKQHPDTQLASADKKLIFVNSCSNDMGWNKFNRDA